MTQKHIIINGEKLNQMLDMLKDRDMPEQFSSWTVADLKQNWEMVKQFVMPKIVEGIKECLELVELSPEQIKELEQKQK